MFPILLFLGGVVFALLAGATLQEFYQRHGLLTRQQWLEFKKFQAGFELDHVALGALKVADRRLEKFYWISPTLGYLSGLLFVVGAALIFFS